MVKTIDVFQPIVLFYRPQESSPREAGGGKTNREQGYTVRLGLSLGFCSVKGILSRVYGKNQNQNRRAGSRW